MDELIYNKIQEILIETENRLREVGRAVGHQPIEKEKVFGFIFMHGDDKGCTTQIVSPAPIAAMMILQLLNNRPEIAQEIKRIQTLQKLESLASFLEATIPDDDEDDNKDEEEEECEE